MATASGLEIRLERVEHRDQKRPTGASGPESVLTEPNPGMQRDKTDCHLLQPH